MAKAKVKIRKRANGDKDWAAYGGNGKFLSGCEGMRNKSDVYDNAGLTCEALAKLLGWQIIKPVNNG